VVFASLGTFAHNMRDFGMPRESVLQFVKKQAEINELDQNQVGGCLCHLSRVRPAIG
jgi:hypothetical protein